ncbi:hypothetical protein [Stappia sp. ES.058]|uniref:hypothetical protein n=1 Tax=Stappia sp. ES.058 TaxID=1881061 RepID=UPI000879297F|nr:hypothetical protein [Stappia sp. ES.058]SDU42463.1 hypothetical protein SAMN05428979_3697 [Stappia sp. ES.058]
MIFGHLHIDERSVSTHRDSYLLPTLSVVSVRRPLLAPALILAGGISGFAAAFSDLLYPGEIEACIGIAIGAAFSGFHLAQLQLLSRDLRGSELTGAVWGTRGELDAKRREIVAALPVAASNGGVA